MTVKLRRCLIAHDLGANEAVKKEIETWKKKQKKNKWETERERNEFMCIKWFHFCGINSAAKWELFHLENGRFHWPAGHFSRWWRRIRRRRRRQRRARHAKHTTTSTDNENHPEFNDLFNLMEHSTRLKQLNPNSHGVNDVNLMIFF